MASRKSQKKDQASIHINSIDDSCAKDREPAEGGKVTIEEAIEVQSHDLPAAEEEDHNRKDQAA